jgi:hypothetical protein
MLDKYQNECKRILRCSGSEITVISVSRVMKSGAAEVVRIAPYIRAAIEARRLLPRLVLVTGARQGDRI